MIDRSSQRRLPLFPLALVLGGFLFACGQQFGLPPEPSGSIRETGYNYQGTWSLDAPGPIAVYGSIVYVIEAESAIKAYDGSQLTPRQSIFINEFEQLVRPIDLSVSITNANGVFVYVADAGDSTVKRYDFRGGVPQMVFRDSAWAEISGIASDERLDVYVSDAVRDTIMKYDLNGDPVRLVSDNGSGFGFVDGPTAMHWNGKHLVVADTDKNWVQRIERDQTNVAASDGPPIGLNPSVTGLNRPQGVTTDLEAEYIFVADTEAGRILQFNLDGSVKDSVYTEVLRTQNWVDFATGEPLVATPVDAPRHVGYLELDNGSKQAFVSDPANDRVLILKLVE